MPKLCELWSGDGHGRTRQLWAEERGLELQGPKAAPRTVTECRRHPPEGRPRRPGSQSAHPTPHRFPICKHLGRHSCRASVSEESTALCAVNCGTTLKYYWIDYRTSRPLCIVFGSYWLIQGKRSGTCVCSARVSRRNTEQSFRFLEQQVSDTIVEENERYIATEVRASSFPCAHSVFLEKLRSYVCALISHP